MKPPGPNPTGIYFWDSSALVSLVLVEINTPIALQANETARQNLAWDWIQVEARAALRRQKANLKQIHTLEVLLGHFDFINSNRDDYPGILRVIDRHKLRAADAGHFFYLSRAKTYMPDLEFVCFDNELVRAAKAEKIRVFGKP